ncbi:hypothetical protein [Streptomyces mirabilis]|uniref:hypothetical protein n=1 Tax=Streptomyces mirabilis TaxID=68239 RepID=UPI0036877298
MGTTAVVAGAAVVGVGLAVGVVEVGDTEAGTVRVTVTAGAAREGVLAEQAAT